jgi:alanyl-tRNA synthetase
VINGINVICRTVPIEYSAIVKDICFQLKNELPNLFLALGVTAGGKANLSIIISDNLVSERGLHAGNMIRTAAKAINGGGGGQPFYATAGGSNPDGFGEVWKILKEALK